MKKITRCVLIMLIISFSGMLGWSTVFADPVLKYSFLVKVPGKGLNYFSSCTGLGSESEVNKLKIVTAGGGEIYTKLPMALSSINTICKRPILPKSCFWDWNQNILKGNKESYSENILVVALDVNMKEIAWWLLYKAWPSKVTCIYDGDRFMEEVVLVSDRTERLNKPPKEDWHTYKLPTPGLSTVKPPKVEMATGYVAAQKGGQQIDLSGKWTSNIGLAYQISQSGNKLSYQDPLMHKPVNGTIDGKTVTVTWMEGNNAKNLKGTVTEVGNDGKAKRIEWENKVVFNR